MDAGIIEFGDAEAAIRLVEEAGKATPMGRILGSGTAATARCFGLERAPVVKGQAMPGYDPRMVKSAGITYATSTQGADPIGGYAVASIFSEINGDTDSMSIDGQVEESRNLQIVAAILDSTGFCLFVAFAILDDQETFDAMVEMINAMYDLTLTGGDVVELGKNVLRMEREFNENVGFTKAHDRLPKYFSREPLPPHNVVFDVSNEELDRVHVY